MNHRIYLDNCCFNRPYDDQNYLLVQLETEAKLFVQQAVLQGKFELVWSYILDYENSANPYQDRKESIVKWKEISTIDVDVSKSVIDRANEIMSKNIKKKDALHIACAIEAKCDYFLSTDRKLLQTSFENISVINPIDFIKILNV